MARHRGHGEGTVYYRSSNDDWYAQLTSPDGARKTVGYGKTKKIAQQKLRLYSPQFRAGQPNRSRSVTSLPLRPSWREGGKARMICAG